MVNFKSSFSFDDSELKKLRLKPKELNGQREVPLPELMPDNFIREYTNFQSLQAMFDASGIQNLKEIGNEKFSKFISTHTGFSTWEEMVKVAKAKYVKRKLGD